MDSYLLLKLIHIISAVVVVGTGAGIAFFMLMAFRSKNLPAIYITAKHVILGDWIFTNPAISKFSSDLQSPRLTPLTTIMYEISRAVDTE